MKNFIDTEALASAFANVGRTIGSVLNTIANAFYNAAQSLTKNNNLIIKLKKPISRKKFIKLLIANKIQRNEANIIAKQIHDTKGGYCLLFLNEILNNREIYEKHRNH